MREKERERRNEREKEGKKEKIRKVNLSLVNLNCKDVRRKEIGKEGKKEDRKKESKLSFKIILIINNRRNWQNLGIERKKLKGRKKERVRKKGRKKEKRKKIVGLVYFLFMLSLDSHDNGPVSRASSRRNLPTSKHNSRHITSYNQLIQNMYCQMFLEKKY